MNVDRLNLEAWSGRVDPEADSPRWHQRIQPLGESRQPGLVLLGFACDEGVRRNQGRVGAASAPAAIRKLLANLAWHRQGQAFDAGDVCCLDGDLDGAQQRLGASVAELLDAGHLPVVLGGGHEVAYGSWQGIAAHLANKLGRAPRLAIVNFDAHFDLRDPAHIHSSGTPFAQIAEACAVRGWPFRYACLGVSRAANTRALFQRASELGVLVREDFEIRESSLESIGAELDAFIADCDAVYLTVDLDVLPAWEGPGVSAPAAHGVSVALLEPLIERLQASGKLLLAELAELNPEHDQDHRTARVAARLIHKLSLHG
ncbi:formiminoglutamase [Pseudomonas linyingensis]|uniref:Formimidoylglutamase n=1 Tax=Pseudomonas linyingensis TaxID=915471 RepID=A0A1H7ALG8_9PSED|nr:formimidoylglutamase [Pseudomonas linyingensis]SEJ62922.1 formiminoglutamase [Pseudomonas linyingensis]